MDSIRTQWPSINWIYFCFNFSFEFSETPDHRNPSKSEQFQQHSVGCWYFGLPSFPCVVDTNSCQRNIPTIECVCVMRCSCTQHGISCNPYPGGSVDVKNFWFSKRHNPKIECHLKHVLQMAVNYSLFVLFTFSLSASVSICRARERERVLGRRKWKFFFASECVCAREATSAFRKIRMQ